MAELRNLVVVRHLRADASAHVLHHAGGKLRRSGKGLSFWFLPLSASIAELPADDRELTLIVHARSLDYQDVTVQGTLTYRVVDPARLASRVDFTIDLAGGHYVRQPIEKIELLLSQLAQQHTLSYVAVSGVRDVLTHGHVEVRSRVAEALASDESLVAMGLMVVAVRISSIAPTPEVERALEAPMRERIQQEADEAAFSRRALAVEKERAIRENELVNRIELARREEQLIVQEGQNARRKAGEDAESARIGAEAEGERARLDAQVQSDRTRVGGDAEAHSIRAIGTARAEAELAKMEAYRNMPPTVLTALAAREFASKLRRIEHLNISPDLLGPALQNFLTAAAARTGES
ncbi:MAG: hypothetical protein RL701_1745 [Pseudomonadota bacterium]